MRLREEELGIKVAYRGQELYSHVAFANEAARLANEIGDINGFLLPTVRNQLPEAVRNTLKGLGKKPKTWEDFRKAMTAIQLSDLREEAAEITKRDGFYAEVAAMRIRPTGHSPGITRAASQPRQTTAGTQNRLQTPQATLTNAPPPRYQPAPPTPRTPTQNRMPFPSNPRSNPFPMTPDTGRNPPATGTNTTLPGKTREPTRDQFTDWDRRTPYPKTTEGKAAYEVAIQAWWERNRFNGRASAADLIPLTPGTMPVGTNECYACGRNDSDDARWSSRRGKTDRRKGKARSRDNHTCITNRKRNEQHFSRITIEHHEPLLYFSSGDNSDSNPAYVRRPHGCFRNNSQDDTADQDSRAQETEKEPQPEN